jgi:hypothetical protein
VPIHKEHDRLVIRLLEELAGRILFFVNVPVSCTQKSLFCLRPTTK